MFTKFLLASLVLSLSSISKATSNLDAERCGRALSSHEAIRTAINAKIAQSGLLNMKYRTNSLGDIDALGTMNVMAIVNGEIVYRQVTNPINRQLWVWTSDIDDATGVWRDRYISLIDDETGELVHFEKIY